MCMLQIYAQGYDMFLEVLPDEVQSAELTVEEVVSHVLLDLFGEGTVDDVTIRFSSGLHMGLHHCSIDIHAQCACQRFAQHPHTKENIKLTVKKSLQALLKELFGTVQIDSVTLIPAPWDYENDSALSCRA